MGAAQETFLLARNMEQHHASSGWAPLQGSGQFQHHCGSAGVVIGPRMDLPAASVSGPAVAFPQAQVVQVGRQHDRFVLQARIPAWNAGHHAGQLGFFALQAQGKAEVGPGRVGIVPAPGALACCELGGPLGQIRAGAFQRPERHRQHRDPELAGPLLPGQGPGKIAFLDEDDR